MTSTQELVIERHHADALARSISDLQTLSGQLGGIESIDAERTKAQAKLDNIKRETAGWKNERDEVKRAYDKILAEAHAEQANKERLVKENEALSAQNKQMNEWRDKMLQQLQG
jgi:hypothetical protein